MLVQRMIKFPSSYSEYILGYLGREEEYVPQMFSLASDNEYVPIMCIPNGHKLEVEGRKDFSYNLDIPRIGSTTRRASIFIQAMTYLSSWSGLIITEEEQGDQEVDPIYGCCSNGLFFKNESRYEPIVLLCVKKEHLFSIDKNNPNSRHFNLLVSNSVMTIHSKIFKTVFKEYIPKIIEDDIDIVYTNNVERLCFNSPKFTLPPMEDLDSFTRLSTEINTLTFSNIHYGR